MRDTCPLGALDWTNPKLCQPCRKRVAAKTTAGREALKRGDV